MPRKEPVIITGVRSPGDHANPEIGVVSPNTPAAAAVPAKPGVRRYESSGKNFRILLIDDPDIIIDGHVVKGKKATAQFVDGKYETANPRYQEIIEASDAFARKDVWDADKLDANIRKAQEEAAVNAVLANPALMAKVAERLEAKKGLNTMELPPPEKVEEPVPA